MNTYRFTTGGNIPATVREFENDDAAFEHAMGMTDDTPPLVEKRVNGEWLIWHMGHENWFPVERFF